MAMKKPRASAEIRAKAVEMKANGYTARFIAAVLGVSVNSVFNWQRWAREERGAGLADKAPERSSALGDAERAEVFFGDESAVQMGFHAGTIWGRMGATPVVEAVGAVGGRKTIMMVSAISRQGQLRFRLHQGSFDAKAFIDFCKRLMKSVDRPVFLIVDNARVHHAKIVKAFEAQAEGRLRLFYLPAYAPALNPDELVWNTVKRGIGCTAIKDAGGLHRTALGVLRRLQKLPATIKSFFEHPELAYIGTAASEYDPQPNLTVPA